MSIYTWEQGDGTGYGGGDWSHVTPKAFGMMKGIYGPWVGVTKNKDGTFDMRSAIPKSDSKYRDDVQTIWDF